MHTNDLIRMQQQQGPKAVEEHNPLDDAYPWVISHCLFPAALLSTDGWRHFWASMIAQDTDISLGLVEQIIELEVSKCDMPT